jgi:hypothetical protein
VRDAAVDYFNECCGGGRRGGVVFGTSHAAGGAGLCSARHSHARGRCGRTRIGDVGAARWGPDTVPGGGGG